MNLNQDRSSAHLTDPLPTTTARRVRSLLPAARSTIRTRRDPGATIPPVRFERPTWDRLALISLLIATFPTLGVAAMKAAPGDYGLFGDLVEVAVAVLVAAALGAFAFFTIAPPALRAARRAAVIATHHLIAAAAVVAWEVLEVISSSRDHLATLTGRASLRATSVRTAGRALLGQRTGTRLSSES